MFYTEPNLALCTKIPFGEPSTSLHNSGYMFKEVDHPDFYTLFI